MIVRLFGAVVSILLLGTFAAHAAEQSREYKTAISRPLAESGVHATVASLASEGSLITLPKVAVYMIFDLDYKGVITLRGIRNDGKETARSEPREVTGKKGEAGKQEFAFPKDSDLSQVSKVYVLDQRGNPPAKDKSFKEEAGEIINELFN